MLTRALAVLIFAFAIDEDAGAPSASSASSPPGEAENEETPPPAPAEKPAPHAPKPAGFLRQPTVIRDGMVMIPGGKFTMGSSEPRAPTNEKPAHVVSVPTFWIDRTEVTVGAYRACVERGKCRRPVRSSTTCTYDLGDPLLPVSCVSWETARTYCLAAGKRLPREAEWEAAARGPTPVRYPWGGGISCALAITLVHDGTQRSCGKKGPVRVGTKTMGASAFGVLDMSGNVEEWVSDWYGETTSDLSPRAGSAHVLRGGGWLTIPSQAKTTSRNWGSVREAGPNVGFRCARDD